MPRIKVIYTFLGLAGLMVIQFLIGSPANAQQGAAAALEEIVVTARRREESLQDVPIAITAMTSEELGIRSIERTEDMDTYIPNVSIMAAGSEGDAEASFTMRGIPGVGLYIDGIWQPSNTGLLTMNIVEVERIEVLRGPQGTLFGKNTVGGAIQYVTRPPAEEFGARVKITTGDFDRRDVTVSVDIPLSDTLLTKVTAGRLTRDGFIKSLTVDRAYGDVNDTVIRGDLLWTPSDRFNLRFSADYNEVARNGQARVMNDLVLTCKPGKVGGRTDSHPANFCGKATLTRPATYGAVGLPYNHLTHVAGYPGGEVGEYETKSDYNVNGIVQDFDRYTLEMTWDLSDNISLSSLTGSRDMYSRTYIDFGADEYGLFTRDRKRENNFTSQEFKLQGTVGDRIDWVGGVYYWDYYQVIRHDSYSFVDFRDDPDTVGTVEGAHLLAALAASGHKRPLSPGPKTAMDGFANTGLAWFGEVNFALGDKLDLSAGVRFNDEDHTAYGYTSTGTKLNPARPDVDMGGCVFCRTTKQTLPTTFDSTTPRVALSYSASDDVMVYGSYAEGFGAGGIAAIDIPGLPASMSYDPEETQSFELGLRGNFLDDRFRLSATIFSTNWDKIQVSETLKDPSNPGQNLPEAEITNAGTASADGVEIEGRLLVSDALQLDFTVGMLDTAYTSLGQATQIKVGDTFRQAPELTWSIGLQHDTALTNGGTFTTRLDYGFVDDYVRVRESQRQTFQESYSKLNARFNYEPPEGDWRLSVFGTNLTDERYLNGGFLSTGFAFDLATVARPREVGASLEFFFD